MALLTILSSLLSLSVATVAAASQPLLCNPDSIASPILFGAEILSVTAEEIRNYSTTIFQDGDILSAVYTGLNFCAVNVTYAHPGWNDTILVQVWLSLTGWNGRFVGSGGSGWVTGYGSQNLAPFIAGNYSVASTDGGHSPTAVHPTWGLASPGNVDYYLLQDFASVALSDMTIIGKAITQSFYGKAPSYSYWVGCGTGGRQGLMLAQRYPELYNGIVAAAPAINWDSLTVAEYWAQHIMNQIDVYPPACELDAFTEAAISACDGIDGVTDGIVADETVCHFDPHSVVGQKFLCNGAELMVFTSGGADVAEAAWTGPVDSTGKRQFYGLNHDANLTAGLVGTTTIANGTRTGAPFSIATDWINYFVKKDANFLDVNISDAEYFDILHESRNQYASIMDTSDADLSSFDAYGGKMITWHGLADQFIFPEGSVDYYKRVTGLLPNVQDFYRLFLAPGVGYCGNGTGPTPAGGLEELIVWVEQGPAPKTLPTINFTATGPLLPGQVPSLSRSICAWPLVQKYIGGDPSNATSFSCEEGQY
ncbi:hypothetical protein LTR29_017910 [Friedmanniomyces endolithicus]|nr:hypothetical protein LTR29_017910 [Friedmanniomyces endolithicus]